KGDIIAAVGYVYEFGRGQLDFAVCANTARNAKESLADYLAKWPDASADEFRWNSGNYDYPGQLAYWSETLWSELRHLDQLAANPDQSKTIHDAIANICCEVLAELAKRGVFGDWSVIDFNVAALLDDEGLTR